jgi:hypothetical protein
LRAVEVVDQRARKQASFALAWSLRLVPRDVPIIVLSRKPIDRLPPWVDACASATEPLEKLTSTLRMMLNLESAVHDHRLFDCLRQTGQRLKPRFIEPSRTNRFQNERKSTGRIQTLRARVGSQCLCISLLVSNVVKLDVPTRGESNCNCAGRIFPSSRHKLHCSSGYVLSFGLTSAVA